MSTPKVTPTGLLRLIVAVLVLAAIATTVGIWFAGDKRSDVAVELAKAGIQVGFIAMFSAIITQGLKRLNDAREARLKQADIEREERRRLNEYRLTIFRESVEVYNRVKTVRRTLRALGIWPSAIGSLSSEQLTEFNAQMRALNEAELSLERIRREVEAQRKMFPNAWEQLDALAISEKYLRNVLNVWETRALLNTSHDEPQKAALKDLENFLAKRRTTASQFWPRFDAFDRAIRADLVSVEGLPS